LTCEKDGGEKKYIQGFGGEIRRKRTLGKSSVRYQDNTKIISKQDGGGGKDSTGSKKKKKDSCRRVATPFDPGHNEKIEWP
jgi:hypothetical protein